MEERSCFENCAPPRRCQLALRWVVSARGFTEVRWVPQGKDAILSLGILQALTSPQRPTKVNGIATYHRSRPWVKSWWRNWDWSYILCRSRCASAQVEEKGKNQEGKKAGSLEQTWEIQVTRSQQDSHAEHKFSNTTTGTAQPRSKGFRLHGSLNSGCSHFWGAFTVVVEPEWWHVLIERKCSSTQFCLEQLLPWLFVFCSQQAGLAVCKEKPEKASNYPGQTQLTGKPQPRRAQGEQDTHRKGRVSTQMHSSGFYSLILGQYPRWLPEHPCAPHTSSGADRNALQKQFYLAHPVLGGCTHGYVYPELPQVTVCFYKTNCKPAPRAASTLNCYNCPTKLGVIRSCCLSQKKAARKLSPKLLHAQMFNGSFLEGYHWQAGGRLGHWTENQQPPHCKTPLVLGWVPAGEKRQTFPNGSRQVSALRRATLQGADTAIVSLDLTVVKATKRTRRQDSRLQLEALPVAIMTIWACPTQEFKIWHPWWELVAWR